MRILLHFASFILALFIGNSMSVSSAGAEYHHSWQVAQNIPFWASSTHECSYNLWDVKITYSKDGRNYFAKVDTDHSFGEGMCQGTVDLTGDLERTECDLGLMSPREIHANVAEFEIEHISGSNGAICKFGALASKLRGYRNQLAQTGSRLAQQSGVTRQGPKSKKNKDSIRVGRFWAGHEADYDDGGQELSIKYSADGKKYTATVNSSSGGSIRNTVIGNVDADGNLESKDAGSTRAVEGTVIEPIVVHTNGGEGGEFFDEVLAEKKTAMATRRGSKLKKNKDSVKVGRFWAGHSASFPEGSIGNVSQDLDISYSSDGKTYDAVVTSSNGAFQHRVNGRVDAEGNLQRKEAGATRALGGTVVQPIVTRTTDSESCEFYDDDLADKKTAILAQIENSAIRQALAKNAKRQLEKRLNKKAGSESASRSGQTKPVNPTQKNKGGANSDRSIEKKDAALEKARALAQAKVQAAEKKKRALEKARALAQVKYLSKRSNAEHYLAVIKKFVKLNPSVLDPLVIAELYGPSLSEVKKGGFNKPGSKFLQLVAYMRKTEGFDAFLQTQNKKRAEYEATKLADLRSEISSVVDALKARLSADPLAPDAYKLITLIKKFDKRPDKVVNLSALQKSRDNLLASAASFGISISETVTKKAAQPVQARSAAKNYGVAVIIGNKNYSGDIPDVAFAHNDAKAMKRYVMDFLGFRNGNIVDLRDASKAQMESAFGVKGNYKGLLWQYLRSDVSDVVVFYSGHGVPGLKDGRGYLLPVDSHPQTAELNGYPIDLLYENLGKLAARSVMVFIDSCFSGGSANGMLIKAASPVFVRTTAPKPVKGMIVVTAASNDQVASWDEKAKHGLFTKYLLDGLYGKADGKRYGNGDGRITLGEMKAYLDGEMTYQARRRFGRVQEATVQGNKKGFLARLSTSSPRP